MKDVAIGQTEIRNAVFLAIPTPIVAVDGEGTVVEWNHAAEKCTGIPREEVLSTAIWDVHARIAPATIPYEQARDRSREQFQTLVAMSSNTAEPWSEEYEGEILSTQGELHHIRSEVFPLWLHHHLFLVGVLSTEETFSSQHTVESAHR